MARAMLASALILRACYFHLRDEGLASEEFLRTILAPLQAPAALHPNVDARVFARAMTLVAPRAGVALKLGAIAPTKVLGLVGELVAQCSTLRGAASAVSRFLFLLQPGGDLRVADAGDRTLICYEPPPGSGRARRFATEFALSLIVSVAREFLGKHVAPREVAVPFPAPAHANAYDACFACPVNFGAGAAAVAFDARLLEVQQLFADPELQRSIEARLARIVQCEQGMMAFHDRVHAVLEREGTVLLAGGTPDLIARRLGISPRVLRRKLASEGKSLSSVVAEFRKQQAMWLIGEQGEPLKVVADRLGFSQTSAFHRAFRRWTGMTPNEFRLGTRRNGQSVVELSAARA
jgi:AraC-like DNA-binding protein